MLRARSREELKRMLVETSLRFGDFILRSGQKSSYYFDKYQFEAIPSLLKDIAWHMQEIVPADTQVLAGLELGGIPLATALSLELVLEAAFVRKKAKTYGTCLINEGADVRGKIVCVIEDVVTTGGQVLKSVEDLRKGGAVVTTVVCVILRGGPEIRKKFEEQGLELRALFDMTDLEALVEAKRIQLENQGGPDVI